jgi:hypothetical protein
MIDHSSPRRRPVCTVCSRSCRSRHSIRHVLVYPAHRHVLLYPTHPPSTAHPPRTPPHMTNPAFARRGIASLGTVGRRCCPRRRYRWPPECQALRQCEPSTSPSYLATGDRRGGASRQRSVGTRVGSASPSPRTPVCWTHRFARCRCAGRVDGAGRGAPWGLGWRCGERLHARQVISGNQRTW